MSRGVVITGMGAVTPLGVGVAPTWERWCAGESGLEGGLGHCRDFVATDALPRKQVRRHDRCVHLGVAAAKEAQAEAGWAGDLPYDSERVATIIGSCLGGLERLESGMLGVDAHGMAGVDAFTLLSCLANAGPAAMALELGLHGPAYAVNAACASGSDAIGVAAGMIA